MIIPLSEKETVQLRLKCLEPFIVFASKNGVMKDEIFPHAEKAWEFATRGITRNQKKTTSRPSSERK